MSLGTVIHKSKMYNLDDMKKEDLEKILNENKKEITDDIIQIKKICKRDFEDSQNMDLSSIAENIEQFFNNSSSNVKIEAMLYKALSNNFTNTVINNKIKNQKNSIEVSINKINSKFYTSSKSEKIKKDLENLMSKYSQALNDLAEFYDNKIEQLILKKVELQAELIGKIIRIEYLAEKEQKQTLKKENDNLLKSLSNSIKNAMSKLTKKKKENEIDVAMISKLMDKEDVEEEQMMNFNNKINDTQKSQKNNDEEISFIESEIVSIENEINRLNENKITMILNAMESKEKGMILFKDSIGLVRKIKVLFKSIFNPAKLIVEEVLNPFENCINEFVENEIKNKKVD